MHFSCGQHQFNFQASDGAGGVGGCANQDKQEPESVTVAEQTRFDSYYTTGYSLYGPVGSGTRSLLPVGMEGACTRRDLKPQQFSSTIQDGQSGLMGYRYRNTN
eukprot:4946966-Prymnesium_polylepis.1